MKITENLIFSCLLMIGFSSTAIAEDYVALFEGDGSLLLLEEIPEVEFGPGNDGPPTKLSGDCPFEAFRKKLEQLDIYEGPSPSARIFMPKDYCLPKEEPWVKCEFFREFPKLETYWINGYPESRSTYINFTICNIKF